MHLNKSKIFPVIFISMADGYFKFTAEDLIIKNRISKENVDAVKEFIDGATERNIPKNISNEFIATILIACSNDVELAKMTIVAHFNIKKMSAYLFNNRNLNEEDLKLALQTTCFSLIHWPEESVEILYVKMRDTNYRNCYMEPQLKVSNMILDSVHTKCPPDGIIIVQDIEGISLMHITRLKFDSMRIFFSYIQEGLPVKLRAVHYINTSNVLNKLMKIFKLFIKPELYNKIYFHKGTETLTDYIPKGYIPNDYNGELSSLEEHHQIVVKRLKDMQQYWIEEEALRNSCSTTGEYITEE